MRALAPCRHALAPRPARRRPLPLPTPRRLPSPPSALDPATAGTVATALRPILSIGELMMVVRIVLTWYPDVNGDTLPWAIVVKPTEPLLAPTRKLVPPLAGVDVSPVVWVALLSLVGEVLVGPQGILVLLSKQVVG